VTSNHIFSCTSQSLCDFETPSTFISHSLQILQLSNQISLTTYKQFFLIPLLFSYPSQLPFYCNNKPLSLDKIAILHVIEIKLVLHSILHLYIWITSVRSHSLCNQGIKPDVSSSWSIEFSTHQKLLFCSIQGFIIEFNKPCEFHICVEDPHSWFPCFRGRMGHYF